MDDEVEEPESDPLENFAVVRSDGSAEVDFPVGVIIVPDSDQHIPVILVTKISNQFLLAVPFEAWHRLKHCRLLPVDSLVKPVLVEVLAVRDLDREVVEDGVRLKVWLGLWKFELNSCLHFTATDPDSFSCNFVTEGGEGGFVPYGESLAAVADEKFAFLTAASGEEKSKAPAREAAAEEDPALARIARLEETMVSIQGSLQQLLKTEAKNSTPTAKAAAKVPLDKKPVDGLPGLDQQVVASALAAGVDPSQLEAFSRMMMEQKPKIPDAPGQKKRGAHKLTVLGESEEERNRGRSHRPPIPTCLRILSRKHLSN